MHVDYGEIALTRTGIEPPEDEFPGSRNIEQGEILGGRSNEDQIIILGVVEREQRAALDANGAIEQVENAIQLVDGQHFPHASVVIENEGARIGRRIEVA